MLTITEPHKLVNIAINRAKDLWEKEKHKMLPELSFEDYKKVLLTHWGFTINLNINNYTPGMIAVQEKLDNLEMERMKGIISSLNTEMRKLRAEMGGMRKFEDTKSNQL